MGPVNAAGLGFGPYKTPSKRRGFIFKIPGPASSGCLEKTPGWAGG